MHPAHQHHTMSLNLGGQAKQMIERFADALENNNLCQEELKLLAAQQQCRCTQVNVGLCGWFVYSYDFFIL